MWVAESSSCADLDGAEDPSCRAAAAGMAGMGWGYEEAYNVSEEQDDSRGN